ncbi:MAG: hypothetical protein ACXADA_07700 [Candidatus Hodarchaeales archaeon]
MTENNMKRRRKEVTTLIAPIVLVIHPPVGRKVFIPLMVDDYV